MSYIRVIPRDLFNEANLLKCYGQLYINLERLGLEDCLVHDEDDAPFAVYQSQDDGSTTIANVTLVVNGAEVYLRRPLNSRAAYPLRAQIDDDTDIAVFTDAGEFSADMLVLLGRDLDRD